MSGNVQCGDNEDLADFQTFCCQEDGCTRTYSAKRSLSRHLKNDHGKLLQGKGRFICEECGGDFVHAKSLINHYGEDHGVQIEMECKEFHSWQSFESWKEAEEESTRTYFVKPKGDSMSDDFLGEAAEHRNILYTCCRDGKKRINETSRKTDKTRKCLKGSRKLPTFCLARMYVKVIQATGKVEVLYNSTHTNHFLGKEEYRYIPLSKSIRKEIQEKFSMGITLERIMDDIRQELGKRHCRDDFDEKARKRHLINRQDCRNACRKVKDFKNHRHEDDAISVDRIVKELQQEDPSPIIAYKPVGEKDGQLQKSNFLLAMMTNFQATMFRKFPELVCVDSTHKTNEYGYKLVTVLVADEFKNGQPVAWAIMDKEDTVSYRGFFKAIQLRVPEAKIDVVMTDDDSSIVSAFQEVYPTAIHILCRWHVDRAWQKKLTALVHDTSHKAEIYKYLWLLMTEPDPNSFHALMEGFLEAWDESEPKFAEYFREYYTNRVDITEKWAMAFRHFEHKDTDTNMFVESFHNKLKTNPRYLNHNVNRRCDDLIEVLLTFEVDMFFERKRKEFLTTTTEASRKMEGDRHCKAQNIDDSRISIKDVKGIYAVKSSDEKSEYAVSITSETCKLEQECVPHCIDSPCGFLCRHMVKCTCYDYQHGHLCKHAHKIYGMHTQKNEMLAECSKLDNDCTYGESDTIADIVENEQPVKCVGVKPSKSAQNEAGVKGKKETILKYLKEVTELVQFTDDHGALDHTLANVIPVATALKSQTLNCQKSEISSFSATDKFAPAQKNERQLKFVKLKTPGRKKSKSLLKKPNEQEKENLLKQLEETVKKSSLQTSAPKKEQKKVHITRSKPDTQTKSVRCRQCDNCLKSDCGVCSNCLDKKKFGGLGKKKQACVHRKCLQLQNESTVKSASKFTATGFKRATTVTNSHDDTESSIFIQCEAPILKQPKLSKAITDKINPQQANLDDAVTMLTLTNRKIKKILGDGNCLFRSLALILYGDEMCHGIMRELLANFLSQNRKYFQPYVDGQMVEYIAKVKQTRVWGTAVELLAAATLFGIPVYTFLPNGNSYHWLCYEPLQSDKFVYPQDPPPLRLLNLDHIELFNVNGCHYDVIVSSEGGVLDKPLLSNKVDTITLN